ncbi:unnamed protein product [Mesocestoides corti]|uniref:Transmembrane protein n=1 Tax=Mesocestoides corti TaxID=53468 RepID=A0A158QU66_MESCO|nr:unnamed protein product [Mesocestoides corti]
MLTSLQTGLLAVAGVTFMWATDVYDGGFLNDVFMVTANSTVSLRQLALADIVSAATQSLFRGGRQNLEIYRWLPPELQDGADASQKPAILTGTTVLAGILLLVFPICIAVMSCGCCRVPKHSSSAINTKLGSDSPGTYSTSSDARLLEKLHAHTLSAMTSSSQNILKFRIYHGFAFAVTFLLMLSLLAMIVVYLNAGLLLTETLRETPTNSSTFDDEAVTLVGGLRFAFGKTVDFLQTAVVTGRESTQTFLSRTNTTLVSLLEQGVSTAVDELLVSYGVENLLETGKRLRGDLSALQTNMDHIRLNNQKVSADISSLVGQFKVIHDLVHPELQNVCKTDYGPQLNATCSSLKDRSSILIIQFNATAIKVDPPAVLHFLFNELGIDLDALLSQITQVSDKVVEVKGQVLDKIFSFLDLSSFFSPVIQIWETVSNETKNVNETFGNLINQTSKGVDSARVIFDAVVYTPAAILILILVVDVAVTIVYAIEAWKMGLFVKRYVESDRAVDSSMDTGVCNNTAYCVSAIFFALFLLLTSLVVIVVLPGTTVVASSGCVYLTETKGVAQSDYVLNSYIANEVWPGVLGQIEAILNSPTLDFLSLPAPRNVINATTVSCQPLQRASQGGLISAVGWTSFIDVSKLLNSQEIDSKIKEGEKVMKDEVTKLNLASYIPKDLDKLAGTTKNLTQYFDKVDYTDSINELSHDRLPTTELTRYADDLIAFVEGLRLLGLNENPILKRSAELIYSSLKTSQVVEEEAMKLRDAFVAVQMRRNLTNGIDYLLESVETVRVIVSNQTALLEPISGVYSKLVVQFKSDLSLSLSPVIQTFTQDLLPCADLYRAVDALLVMTCKQNGEISRIFAWAYSLSVSILIATLLFFSLFHLAFVQSHQFRRLRISNKTDTNFKPPPPLSFNRYVSAPFQRPDSVPSVPNASLPFSSHLYTHPRDNPQKTSTESPPLRQGSRLAAPIPQTYSYAQPHGRSATGFGPLTVATTNSSPEGLSFGTFTDSYISQKTHTEEAGEATVSQATAMKEEKPPFKPVPLRRSQNGYVPAEVVTRVTPSQFDDYEMQENEESSFYDI